MGQVTTRSVYPALTTFLKSSLDTTIMLRLENRACDLKRLEITQRLILGIFGSLLALLVCGQDFRDIQALNCTRMAEHCSRMMGWSQ
jgi:hypothetical protein